MYFLWFIREVKRNVFTNEEIPSKNRIYMDIQSWYEFQYKMIAFNFRYTYIILTIMLFECQKDTITEFFLKHTRTVWFRIHRRGNVIRGWA